LFAPSIAVTSHVLKHRFQIGQPLLGQGETGAQLGHSLDRNRERVDTRQLGGVNVVTAVFLTAPRRGDQRLRERVSSCRALSAALLAPVRVSSCDPQCPRNAEEGHAVHVTRPVTVRTGWLMIGEGGMSSPPPSAAQALERASVKFAVHK
jgi:hypothetical protein